jgi:DNA-binding IscR family transcriptional regulator
MTMLAGLPRELQTSEAMAPSAGANPVHIRRVLGRLREAGFGASRPGPRGGWQLLRAPERSTLADVWRVIRPGAAGPAILRLPLTTTHRKRRLT